jgi:hypothetical protein
MKIMIEENCDGYILSELLGVLGNHYGTINIATYEDFQEVRYLTIETVDEQ